MVQKTLKIVNEKGLHARASAKHAKAVGRRLCLGLLAAGLALAPALAAADAADAADAGRVASPLKQAHFAQEAASAPAVHLANWVVRSADNQGKPFIIVDKVQARVLVFNPSGQLQGAAPALLGLAIGDDSTPGIGDRKLSQIRPEERTTPAGRFVAFLGRDVNGVELLWVDYSTAIALHRVATGRPSERRAQRLASPTAADNRISLGCINVPAQFYNRVVKPAFTGTQGIVYVLPETRSAQEVFGSYDVLQHPHAPLMAASATSLK